MKPLNDNGLDNPHEQSEKQRTRQQNRSMHKWLEMVADQLNEKGLTAQVVMKAIPVIDSRWSGSLVKDLLFRPVLSQIAGVVSTADGSTKDYPAAYEAISAALAQQLGIQVPSWPDRFSHAEMQEWKNK